MTPQNPATTHNATTHNAATHNAATSPPSADLPPEVKAALSGLSASSIKELVYRIERGIAPPVAPRRVHPSQDPWFPAIQEWASLRQTICVSDPALDLQLPSFDPQRPQPGYTRIARILTTLGFHPIRMRCYVRADNPFKGERHD